MAQVVKGWEGLQEFPGSSPNEEKNVHIKKKKKVALNNNGNMQ